MDWKYKVSVIVSIYDAGKYLERLLQSIFMQTIGFEENVQVIFVNDGATDDSKVICTRFCEKYPDNVEYICVDGSGGEGAAWNTGMKYAEGKYITFMESDGLWSLNAFEAAVCFLDEHNPEIDLVSADMEAYGINLQSHCLNQDLDTGTLVDMNTEYRRLRVNGSSCIMKTEAARRHRFQKQLSGWETTIFVNQVMLEKQKYGMLSTDVRYYYCGRKDKDDEQQCENKKLYDVRGIELFFEEIYGKSMEQCRCFMPMMQYLMAYVLAGCFAGDQGILHVKEDWRDHKVSHILQQIEDRYLAEVCNADDFTRKVMLAFKYGVDFREAIAEREAILAQDCYLQQRRAANNANYNVLKKWFERKAQGKRIDSYFLYNGFSRIAVYGMSDLGKYMVSELRDSAVEVVYGIDQRAETIEADIPVLRLDEDLPEADIIIVTPVYFFDEIQSSLSERVNVPVVSIEDILNVME